MDPDFFPFSPAVVVVVVRFLSSPFRFRFFRPAEIFIFIFKALKIAHKFIVKVAEGARICCHGNDRQALMGQRKLLALVLQTEKHIFHNAYFSRHLHAEGVL